MSGVEERNRSSAESYTEGLMATLFAKPTKHLTPCVRDEAMEMQCPMGASEFPVQPAENLSSEMAVEICHPRISGLSNELPDTKAGARCRIPLWPELSTLPPEFFCVLI